MAKKTNIEDEVVGGNSDARDKLSINVAEIVEAARGRFGKDKKKLGITKYMQTGDQIVLSDDPDDYISSTQINEFWKPLTGIMGLPFGRIVQIAGKPDSGKSSAAMMFMKAAQDQGTAVVLWDAEGKFDSGRFRDRIGGDPSILFVAPSRNIQDGALQVVAFVKSIFEANPEQKILVVWDSVGSSINSAEDEENDDYSKQPGVTAKEVSFAIRRFNQLIEKYRNLETGKYTLSCLCINQVYAKIGFGVKGNQQKGGSELEYLSSLILEMTRKGNLLKTREGQKIKYGITSRAKVYKNHLFGGDDCVSELDVAVTAKGIELAKVVKGRDADVEDDTEED